MNGKFKYLREKYGLKKLKNKEKKFILVMVDALGYNTLMDVKNELPFLSKLMKKNNVTSYNVGIPSTTPYVQAGLFYGYDEIIPGYRFYDKKNKKRIVVGTPMGAAFIEEQLKKKYRGLLYGGSSLGNVYVAGAKRTLFTFPGIFAKSRITNVRDVLSVLLYNPFSFFRVVYFSVKEFFVEIYENIMDHLRRKKYANFSFFYPFFPFFRLGINAFVREVITEAAILEMKRKSPKICVTYLGYDWVSHYRGPRSKSSILVLKEIDKKLKWLHNTAKEEGYDFYVFSDHDIVQGLPFDKLYNQSLTEFITRVKEGKKEIRDSWSDYVSYKLGVLHENFSIPLKAVNTFFLSLFKVRNEDEIKEIEVCQSSCIAHIYFTKHEKRLSLKEVEKYYPGIIDKLVKHEGIGLVVGKEKIIGDLSKYGDEVQLKKWLKKFSNMKYFGDLFVIGAIKDDQIVTFEDFHLGTHDGFGLGQEKGFFLSKKKYNFSNSFDAKVLHEVLKDY
ncbi:hypothetical protein CL616_01165 [archaeon]|nr:hypothetical protein [archaeon]